MLNFRCYPSTACGFAPEGAVFSGRNGSGKTGILEAIHMLLTGRSQRGSKKREMICFGSDEACLDGVFSEGNVSTDVRIGFSRDNRIILKKNGSAVHSFSDFFGTCAMVSFGPQDHFTVSGDPEYRRSFMDMFLSQTDRPYLDSLIGYRKNLDQRNTMLRNGGDPLLLDIYEESLAQNGADIIAARHGFIEGLNKLITQIHGEISDGRDNCSLEYSTSTDTEEALRQALSANRKRDIENGFTSIGPHRDDLKILVNGKSVKHYGSQGQQRSLAVSMKLAALDLLGEKRRARIVLVDDAFSDLDSARTGRIFSFISGKGQLFVSTLLDEHQYLKGLARFSIGDGQAIPQ